MNSLTCMQMNRWSLISCRKGKGKNHLLVLRRSRIYRMKNNPHLKICIWGRHRKKGTLNSAAICKMMIWKRYLIARVYVDMQCVLYEYGMVALSQHDNIPKVGVSGLPFTPYILGVGLPVYFSNHSPFSLDICVGFNEFPSLMCLYTGHRDLLLLLKEWDDILYVCAKWCVGPHVLSPIREDSVMYS